MPVFNEVIRGSRWGIIGVATATMVVAAPMNTMASQYSFPEGSAQDPGREEPKVPPDNSKKNVRDRKDHHPTPMDQGGSAEDTQITRDIRQEINQKKEISVNGKNVKIITIDRVVTLRGPVASAEEKALINDIARKIAGAAKVKNELEVKAQKH